MATLLFLLHIRGLKPLLVFYFRVEEKFAGGKFREIPLAVDIIFAGGKFRAKSKFAKIAKIYSTRKIGVIGAYSKPLMGNHFFWKQKLDQCECLPLKFVCQCKNRRLLRFPVQVARCARRFNFGHTN